MPAQSGTDEITKALLKCRRCGHAYPVENGIPRLLSVTQLDAPENRIQLSGYSYLGATLADEALLVNETGSAARFWHGKLVLCGDCRQALAAAAMGAEAVVLTRLNMLDAFTQSVKGKKVHLIQGNPMHSPLRDELFDLVIVSYCAEYTEEPSAAAAGMLRAAKKGGRGALVMPLEAGFEEFNRLYAGKTRSGFVRTCVWLAAKIRELKIHSGRWLARLIPQKFALTLCRIYAAFGVSKVSRYFTPSVRADEGARIIDCWLELFAPARHKAGAEAAEAWFKNSGMNPDAVCADWYPPRLAVYGRRNG